MPEKSGACESRYYSALVQAPDFSGICFHNRVAKCYLTVPADHDGVVLAYGKYGCPFELLHKSQMGVSVSYFKRNFIVVL